VENYVSITHRKALYARQCQMLFLDSPSYIKRGKKSDPANYRGISLTSNLGKLFNEVLYARILKFLNLNKIIHENQIGFKEFYNGCPDT
jgi:hypothetical protein